MLWTAILNIFNGLKQDHSILPQPCLGRWNRTIWPQGEHWEHTTPSSYSLHLPCIYYVTSKHLLRTEGISAYAEGGHMWYFCVLHGYATLGILNLTLQLFCIHRCTSDRLRYQSWEDNQSRIHCKMSTWMSRHKIPCLWHRHLCFFFQCVRCCYSQVSSFKLLRYPTEL